MYAAITWGSEAPDSPDLVGVYATVEEAKEACRKHHADTFGEDHAEFWGYGGWCEDRGVTRWGDEGEHVLGSLWGYVLQPYTPEED